MRILIIHQYYLMPGRQGGSRFNEMARMWSEAGHDVTVIAGDVDYATGERPARYQGQWITREWDENVRVLRCCVPETYGKGYKGRAFAFLGFVLSSLSATLRVRRPDVVVATSPPLPIAITGWAAARAHFRRVPLIFEMRDLWPESAITTGVISANGLMARCLFALERWACRRADHINVLTPAFKQDLIQRGLAGAERISVIPNGADVGMFSPGPRDNALRREFCWGARTVLMYAGAHGRANALTQLIGAAENLKERSDILIACVGDGPERPALEAEVRRKRLTNISFHGSQAKSRMPDVVRACDIGAAVLQNNTTFRTVYPNKVFDYMACERPTILAIDGVARKLVCEDAHAGLFVPPEDSGALARTVTYLVDNPELRAKLGANGRRWVLDHATRDALATRYLDLMNQMLSRTKPCLP